MSSPRDPLRRAWASARAVLRAGRRFLTLGPSGWILLLRTQRAILRAERRIRSQPQGTLFDDIARTMPGPAAAGEADPDHRARVVAIGDAVDRVARWGVSRPLCLARSLAYRELLQREGISGSWVRVGVRMGPRGFEAHAWVEWDGRVVGESPDYVAGFAPLADARAHAPGDHAPGDHGPGIDPGAPSRPGTAAGASEFPWADARATRPAGGTGHG